MEMKGDDLYDWMCLGNLFVSPGTGFSEITATRIISICRTRAIVS